MSNFLDDTPATNNNTPTEAVAPAPKKESSVIVNLILVVWGIFALGKGVLDLLVWMKTIAAPDFLQTLNSYLASKGSANVMNLIGIEPVINAVLGFWALIAGLRLFGRKRADWGIALVVLSLMTAAALTEVMRWFTVPNAFDLTFWPVWVVMVSGLFGFLGFCWLVLTGKSFD
jgi:hypothetical protein